MKLRFNIFTMDSLQIKYLIIIFISMVTPAVLIGGCLYYLIFTIMARQIGVPEAIAEHLLPVVREINFILAIGLPPLFLLLLFWGMSLSHRCTGPLKRLEEDIEKISKGDYSIRLKIRKDDELKSVAGAVNKLIDELEKKR